jgi:DNA-binding SARP family transcriptional activator/tetratricopeptide (TPR) repeat protein
VTGGVRFRILGPLEVEVGGARLRLRGVRQEKALAALLLAAGRLVTLDELVDAVWAEPPGSARRQIQDLVADLRRALAARGARDGIISTARSGYAAHPTPDELDALRFEELVAAARSAAGPAATAPILRAALDLGRGPTLAGMTSQTLAPAVQRWEQHRLAVLEEWLTLELMLGDHQVVAGEAAALVAEHPLRERPVEVLMVALHRAGRGAEALAAYRQFRDRLVAGSGLEPGTALQTLHLAILRGQPTTVPPGPDAAGPGQPVTAPAPAVPAQLPLDVRGFTGRVTELARLDAVALRCGPDEPATVVTISGTAGVGKTALAVHWAHLRADRYPDGQLYLNLRGFDPAGPPLGPAEAIRAVLEALGVAPQRIPAGLDEQVARYRALLSGRRILVLLDNASDADQVRALLPGLPGCLALVTSRHRLSGLGPGVAAHRTTLDLPPTGEARDLLARRLGADRVAAEPSAVDEIITRCARLPLALAIAAARTRQTGFPLAAVATELRDAGRRLDVLADWDAATDVRAVFSWSYRALSRPAARLFRLLALHPGPDLAAPAAASLAGVPVARVRPLLAELTAAHLTGASTAGRYACHDLLRAYAIELAHRVDDAGERDRARRRALDHYLHTAHRAALLLQPNRRSLALDGAEQGVTPEPLANEAAAVTWFTAERPVLLDAVRHCVQAGDDTRTWQLAWALSGYLERRGRWDDWAAVQEAAVAAARRLGDREGETAAQRSLARSEARLGRPEAALARLRAVLDLLGRHPDPVGLGHTHLDLSQVLELLRRPREALHHAEQALAAFQRAGNRHGQARALNGLGWRLAQLGEFARAAANAEQALPLQRAHGDRIGEAAAWDTLGYARHHLGEHREAISSFEHAVALLRETGDRYHEAETLSHLGDAQQAAGDVASAVRTWRLAWEILDELGHAGADALRVRLSRLEAPAG